MTKKRVLSGIRATGRLHLGNYLGAVAGMLELQKSEEYETLYMVADTHTITTPYSPVALRSNRREVVIDYLAAGLDPEISTLFLQSDIPEHLELAFYFASQTTVARMQHVNTFKEKVRQHPNHVTMALLNYPLLMASDILIYKAELVPVGIDQEPNIEFAREIARKMNQAYNLDFPEPKRFASPGEYVPSVKGEGKMAKSVEGSFINLTDLADEVRKKVRAIPTATESGGKMTSGLKALFTFVHLFIPEKETVYNKQFQAGTLQFGEVKDTIAEAISAQLKPIQAARREIESDPTYVDRVTREGTQKAREIASKTVQEVKEKMGLADLV